MPNFSSTVAPEIAIRQHPVPPVTKMVGITTTAGFQCTKTNTSVQYNPLKRIYLHSNNVTMTVMASQITGIWTVCSVVRSGAYQRKYQSSASLTCVKGIHQWPMDSPHQRPVLRGECFHLMTSSCSIWRNFCYILPHKLYFLAHPVSKISSTWWHFRFNVSTLHG